eukprot:jgi/Mesvir1/12643/Mv02198-RA.1
MAQSLARSLLAGSRQALSRAITLCESIRKDHRAQASELLDYVTKAAQEKQGGSASGSTLRVGLSGPPGVGKSSLIEKLGLGLIARGHRVAVLAVDPSSEFGGGSILGDKTRMQGLASEERAFVRPSPTRGLLGGVAANTSDAITLCEAAGYDMVFVETVGVGQSETYVSSMVDATVLVLHPHAGDGMQGIKRGITEVADLVLIHKADGGNEAKAQATQHEYVHALAHLQQRKPGWAPRVICCSCHTESGLGDVLAALRDFQETMQRSGQLQALRSRQRRSLCWQQVQALVLHRLMEDPAVAEVMRELGPAVESGDLAPRLAAERVAAVFKDSV